MNFKFALVLFCAFFICGCAKNVPGQIEGKWTAVANVYGVGEVLMPMRTYTEGEAQTGSAIAKVRYERKSDNEIAVFPESNGSGGAYVVKILSKSEILIDGVKYTQTLKTQEELSAEFDEMKNKQAAAERAQLKEALSAFKRGGR